MLKLCNRVRRWHKHKIATAGESPSAVRSRARQTSASRGCARHSPSCGAASSTSAPFGAFLLALGARGTVPPSGETGNPMISKSSLLAAASSSLWASNSATPTSLSRCCSGCLLLLLLGPCRDGPGCAPSGTLALIGPSGDSEDSTSGVEYNLSDFLTPTLLAPPWNAVDKGFAHALGSTRAVSNQGLK